MKTIIERLKLARFAALAIVFCLTGSAWAVDYTGTVYEPWSYSAGCVVWRAANNQAFHVSTVADVAADSTIGATYDLSSPGHPWNVFASTVNGQANANYTSPGLTLIFDKAGYKNNSDAQFAPLSLGGMWVKVLQAENTPYCITDTKGDGTDRKVELGAANASTYFKFDKSFTIDRNSATEVKGTATVEIADGATFTINNRASKGAKVDSGNTLVLTGANTGTLKVVAGLTVGGTLDLSAATRPAIDGDVTLSAGSTIVLPAGTDVSETPFTVCSGTLTAGGVIYVKVGTDDAEKAVISTSAGTITAVATTVTYTATIDGDTAFSAIEWTSGGEAATIQSMDIAVLEISGTGVVTGLTEAPAKVTLASGVTLDVTELSAEAFAGIDKSTAGTYRWTSGYPTIVPAGQTYTFVGGDSAENTVVVNALDVRGTLKTEGYFSFTSYAAGTSSTLEVVSGKVTLDPGDNWFRGTLTVEAGATFVNALGEDAVQYGGTFTANIYGTLDMCATRWSLGSNNTLNFHEGCTVKGSGQSSNGTFDWIENATATLNVYGDVTLAAPIRIRSTATVNVNVDTTDQKGLTLAGTIGGGKIVKKGAGLIRFTTNPGYDITCQNGAFTFGVNATPTITYTAKPSNSTSMWYAQQSTWRGTVVIPAIAPGNTSTQILLENWGNANSSLTLNGISGNTWLTSNVTVPAAVTVAGDVGFSNGSKGNTYTFSKIAGGTGNLTFKAWANNASAKYAITELNADNYSGTIVIPSSNANQMTVKLGNIVKTGAEAGDKLVAISNGGGTFDISAATLNGEAAALEVRSDGIYVKNRVTVPEVEHATVSVVVDDVVVGTSAGNYNVVYGSDVTVTYTAAEGYVFGDNVATKTVSFDDVSENKAVTTEAVGTTSAIVAKIMPAETPYSSSVGAAVNAAYDDILAGTAYVQVIDDTGVENVYGALGIGYDATAKKFAKAVATIESADSGYLTAQEALDEAASDATVILKDNTSEALTLANGKTVTIKAKQGSTTYTYTAPVAKNGTYTVDAADAVDGDNNPIAGAKTYTARDWYSWAVTVVAPNATVAGVGETVSEATPTVQFTVTAAADYKVTSVTVGEDAVVADGEGKYSYTFDGPATITVATALDEVTFTLPVVTGAKVVGVTGGTWDEVNGTITAIVGHTVTLTWDADGAYVVSGTKSQTIAVTDGMTEAPAPAAEVVTPTAAVAQDDTGKYYGSFGNALGYLYGQFSDNELSNDGAYVDVIDGSDNGNAYADFKIGCDAAGAHYAKVVTKIGTAGYLNLADAWAAAGNGTDTATITVLSDPSDSVTVAADQTLKVIAGEVDLSDNVSFAEGIKTSTTTEEGVTTYTARDWYTWTLSLGTHLNATVTGLPAEVSEGAADKTVDFTVTADDTYKVTAVKVGDTAIEGENDFYSYEVTGDATITVETELDVATVTFYNEDGTATLQSGDVTIGQVPTAPEAPEKATTAQYTYTFAGWTTEQGGAALAELPAVAAGGATYYAVYAATLRSYLIVFRNADGTGLQSGQVDYGIVPEYKGATPTKASTAEFDYTFDGWDVTPVVVAGEAVYTATYIETKRSYTVTFTWHDGSAESSVEYGATPTAPADPEKYVENNTIYTFAGWSPAIAAVTGAATYTAQYESVAAVAKVGSTYYADLATALNAGKGQDTTVTLLADVDLNGVAWTSVGTADDPFRGTFDGGNHTIRNLSISYNSADTSGATHAGLFGDVNGGTIRNVRMEDVTITNGNNPSEQPAASYGGRYGAIVGLINGGSIDSCTVKNVMIKDMGHIGGIAGANTGNTTISDCLVDGTIQLASGSNQGGGWDVGGIIGKNQSGSITVTNCQVDGTDAADSKIYSQYAAGGIVGFTVADSISGCAVKNVTVEAGANAYDVSQGNRIGAGGIIGCLKGTVSGCELDGVTVKYTDTAEGAYAAVGLVGGAQEGSAAVAVSGITVKDSAAYWGDTRVHQLDPGRNTNTAKAAPVVTYTDAPVAVIGMNYFNSLDAAVDAAVAGDTVTLLQDITYGADREVSVWMKPVNIDLGGHTLTTNSEVSKDAGNNGYKAAAICFSIPQTSAGSITISNGTIITAYGAGVYADDPGLTLTLSNLTIQAATVGTQATAEYSAAVRVTGGSRVVIESGSYSGAYAVAASNSGADFTINGGTFSGPIFFSASTNSGKTKSIAVTGGTFTNSGFVNTNKGTMAVSGGTFDVAVPLECCADGYIPKDNGDGTYGVKAGWVITFVVEGVETKVPTAAGAMPAYDGTPAKAEDDAYTYTFAGWTPTIVAATEAVTYTATFTPVAKSATFTVVVPANMTVTVDGVPYTANTEITRTIGTSVTIVYTVTGQFVGEPQQQEVEITGDTVTIGTPDGYVAPVPAVAEVGGVYKATLAEAVAAVEDGETVTMLADVTLTAPMDVQLGGKAVTLDLGGRTLTGRTNLKSGSLTVQNGTVVGGAQQALNVYGSATPAENYSVLTIAGDVTVTADVYGVCLFGPTYSAKSGYGAVINLAGTVTTTGDGRNGAVFVSGNLGNNVAGDANNVINVTGSITSATDAAIALNGLATVNVAEGAVVVGDTAIAVKRGTLNVTGGTVHATGAKNYGVAAYGNGTEMTGAAISITDTYNKYGPMSVAVSGGVITSDNADALFKKEGAYTNDATMTVTGGEFSSAVPVEFCAEGYIPTYDSTTGTYGVKVGSYVAQIGSTKYESLAEAVSAAVSGETVTLLKSCEGEGIFLGSSNAKTVTIDFGGFTYTVVTPVGSSGTVNQMLHFEAGNTVTLMNGTIKKGEGATGFEMVMQNYCNLTIEGMTIDGTGIAVATYSDPKYQAYPGWYNTAKPQFNYNGSGTSVISDSTITVVGDFGIDDTAKVTIEGDASINANKIATKGTDERYASANPTITVENGAAFSFDCSAILADDQNVVEEDGVYTVTGKTYVAQIGTTKYETLADAVAAANAATGAVTIELLSDLDFSAEAYAGYKWAGSTYNPLTIANDGVTIDLGGHTISNMGNCALVFGHILAKDGRIANCAIRNGTLLAGTTGDVRNSYVLGIAGVDDMTIENVTTLGGINVYTASTGVVIDGCTVQGTKYYTVCAQCGSQVTIRGTTYTKNTDSTVANKSMFWIQGAGSDSDLVTTGNTTGAFGTSIISIEGGDFTVDTANGGAFYLASGVTPTVSGGTFNIPVPANCCAVGFEPAGEEAPYTVKVKETAAVVTTEVEPGNVVTNAVLELTADAAAAIIADSGKTLAEALVAEDTNGLKKWENYVLDIDTTESEDVKAPAVQAAASDTKEEAKLNLSFTPKSTATTGIKVSYKVDTVTIDNGVATTNRADTATAAPAVKLDDLEAGKTKYVTVRAVLTSSTGTETEVEVQKVVGVMAVNSAQQNTIVAVPWESFNGTSITANELVYTGNRTAGDTLTVYVPSTGKYKTWTLDADGGSWASVTTYSLGANGDKTNQQSGNAVDQLIPRGAGVWVYRQNVDEKIYLLGQKPEAETATVTVEKGYNLVAPVVTDSSQTTIAVNEVVPVAAEKVEATANDKVLIPVAGKAPYNLYYNADENAWGYDLITVDGFTVTKTFVKEVSIPTGTGFWYISGANGNKDITIGTESTTQE